MPDLPAQEGIVYVALKQLASWIEQKLKTEVDADDAARLDWVVIGPMQDDPQGINIELFENDLIDPKMWRHAMDPIITRGATRGVARVTGVRPAPRETVSARSIVYQRSFTARMQVWIDNIADFTIPDGSERDYLLHLASVVEGRLWQALQAGGSSIGAGQLIDDFGEGLIDGPFLGDTWAVRQIGESHISDRFLQFWYRSGR